MAAAGEARQPLPRSLQDARVPCDPLWNTEAGVLGELAAESQTDGEVVGDAGGRAGEVRALGQPRLGQHDALLGQPLILCGRQGLGMPTTMKGISLSLRDVVVRVDAFTVLFQDMTEH